MHTSASTTNVYRQDNTPPYKCGDLPYHNLITTTTIKEVGRSVFRNHGCPVCRYHLLLQFCE